MRMIAARTEEKQRRTAVSQNAMMVLLTSQLTDKDLPPDGPHDRTQMLWDRGKLDISAHRIIVIPSSPTSVC